MNYICCLFLGNFFLWVWGWVSGFPVWRIWCLSEPALSEQRNLHRRSAETRREQFHLQLPGWYVCIMLWIMHFCFNIQCIFFCRAVNCATSDAREEEKYNYSKRAVFIRLWKILHLWTMPLKVHIWTII